MAPGRPKKRDSDQSPAARHREMVSTPTHQRSPIKQRKMGISVQQKQALIDNLQLEITERARRLRAQYNLQAQGLRSRIEIRINRIPISMRKMKMGDLLKMVAEKDHRAALSSRPPPVPAKDVPVRSPQKAAPAPSQANKNGRGQKRTSDVFYGDKENENVESPKKKNRGAKGDSGLVRPGQVLSPTSSNSRLNNGRPVSPAKSQIARPGSPLKSQSRTAAATSLLSNFVEKAKSTRNGGTRKVTTTSNTSASSAGAGASAAKTRRAPTASKAPASRPATRTGRRVSANSETSEGSNATVVRKGAASRAGTSSAKKTTGNFTKGTMNSQAKAKVVKTPAASTTRAGRVLRNRG